MKVAIIILHYLKQEMTLKCLESVERLEKREFGLQIIVVNNNPQEDLTKLRGKFSQFEFIKTSENLGFCGGNNFGIKKALKEGADYVLLLNNDTILDKDCLVQLIKVANLIDKGGVFGLKIHFAPGYEFHRDRYSPLDQGKVIWYAGGKIDWQNVLLSHRGVDEVDRGKYDKVCQTDFVSGCSMLIRRETLEKIGLLDEKYFLYLEDADFCVRAKRAGFKILFVPQAKVWHFNAGSSEVGGPLHDYFFTRNRMLFGLKYASLRAKVALVKESTRLLMQGREWQKIGIRDFYLKKFGKGSWS